MPTFGEPHREYVPKIGEEVLVTDRLGTFRVEEIDVERKTAVLRILRSNAIMQDVAWDTVWPLDATAREILGQARAGLGTLRAELIRKLLLNLHVPVAERLLIGNLYADEVAGAIRAILAERGAFPKPRQGTVTYEGAVIRTDTGQPEITWERSHPLDPTTVAERRRKTFTDVDSAISAYIDSEWPRGIDGIVIERRR
jgi:hypothetical protein